MAAITVEKWIAGTAAPIGATVFPLIVTTSAPVGAGSVTFTHKTGAIPTGLGTAEIKSVTVADSTTQYYAEIAVAIPAVGLADGQDMVLTATPSDDNGTGPAVDHAFKVYKFGDDSGANVNASRAVVTTPASMSAIDGHITVFMRAFERDNTTALPGAMVRFTPSPTASIAVNQEIASTTPADLGPGFYYAITDAMGTAAIRIATNSSTVIQQISVLTVMTGIELQRTATGYFVNNTDDRPLELQALWTPPTATVENQQIPIPPSGKFFSLAVSVNGETDVDYKRFVIVNNDTVYPYEQNNDGYIQVRYSALKQSPDPSANSFTYARQNPNGNIACSEPWECGVSGVLDNLPDPSDGPRVLPAPLVTPDPGVGRVINLGTLAPHDGLQLALTNIDPTKLPGWVDPGADKVLTAVFYFYMNGYLRSGDIRTPYVYTSSVATDGIIAPTVKYNNTTKKIEFSVPYVRLPTAGANGWGRGAGNETMKVGFEYTIADGSNPPWYSFYSEVNSWYYIDTGGW